MSVYSEKGHHLDSPATLEPHLKWVILLFESVSSGIFSNWIMNFNNHCYFRKRLKGIFLNFFLHAFWEKFERGCRIQFFNNIFLLESQVQIYKISVSFVVCPVAFVVSDITCVFVYIFSSFESLSWVRELFFCYLIIAGKYWSHLKRLESNLYRQHRSDFYGLRYISMSLSCGLRFYTIY